MSPASLAPDRRAALPAELAALPWQRWLAAFLSAALLVSLATVLRHDGLARLRGAVPATPVFWIAFALYYLALPASEWLIYRRLWDLPGAGFAALLRKLVCNEILLGYSGELSFYLYARRRARLVASPFRAIKDVSILSAMAGNVATLAMAMLAWPIPSAWEPRLLPSGSRMSLAALLAALVLLVALRRRIFALPPAELRFIALVHLGRVTATTLLLGLMWSAALPQVPAATWIALAAVQLIVTRLPFAPNKDIVFAGIAMLLAGTQSAVGELMAVIASLLVATHLAVGLALFAADLATPGDEP